MTYEINVWACVRVYVYLGGWVGGAEREGKRESLCVCVCVCVCGCVNVYVLCSNPLLPNGRILHLTNLDCWKENMSMHAHIRSLHTDLSRFVCHTQFVNSRCWKFWKNSMNSRCTYSIFVYKCMLSVCIHVACMFVHVWAVCNLSQRSLLAFRKIRETHREKQ